MTHRVVSVRSRLVVATALAALALAACDTGSGGSSSATGAGTGTGSSGITWAWLAGASTAGAFGDYGTLSIATNGATPGSREGAATWTDASGNLWLFGGQGFDAAGNGGALSDLWRYTPSTNQWIWAAGATTANVTGVYGTPGVAAATNTPGGREYPVSWTDASGNFWLFGGGGYDSTGTSGYLNDLWRYSPSTGQWTWTTGTGLAGTHGVYGILGVPTSATTPGGRQQSVSWIDASGTLWLFGGYGDDANGNVGSLNDLWKFSQGRWTWVSGAATANAAGTYGSKGSAAAGNVPGARAGAVAWIDGVGDLWLFGGVGFDAAANSGYLNDLWKFTPASRQWTWVAGASTANATATYGIQGTAAAANVPGSRGQSVGWIDSAGSLWVFGGVGVDSSGTAGTLHDLWKFVPSTGLWAWIADSARADAAGAYGSPGAASSANAPGGRLGAAVWAQPSGKVWLFGGQGYDASGNLGEQNDLWSLAL